MEIERCYHPIPAAEDQAQAVSFPSPDDEMILTRSMEVVKSIRVNPPEHYTLKIDSFSLLSSKLKEYKSGQFEAGGHKWKLSLYPCGDRERDGEGYISLYLLCAETNNLALKFEINVIFKFFLYDQIRDNYLIVQDSDGRVRRFHKTKTEHGFSQLIPLATFNNASNGYLVNDSCEFGVEVFVLGNRTKGEHLTLLKPPADDWHCTWTISNFSTLWKNCYHSDEFQVGGRKWKLEIHPRGHLTDMKSHLSLLIGFADYVIDKQNNSNSIFSKFMQRIGMLYGHMSQLLMRKIESEREIYVETKFRVVDQLHGNHIDKIAGEWFSKSAYRRGFMLFMLLSDLHDPSKGYLVDDTLIVQVKFNLIYAVKEFP